MALNLHKKQQNFTGSYEKRGGTVWTSNLEYQMVER